MTAPSQQLVLDLSHRTAMGREDFLVSAANGAAVAAVDGWPEWPQRALAIVGPAGCGKTHLVEVWRARAGGARLSAAALDEMAVEQALGAGAIALEDIDRGVGDERVLFHLLNLARETRLSLIVTSRAAPGDVAIGLPDLRSRLRAMALVTIEPPDAPLLAALLVKLFADRQLKVEPQVISHLALHIGHSAEAASLVVATIDRLSLQRRRKVTVSMANEALKGLSTP